MQSKWAVGSQLVPPSCVLKFEPRKKNSEIGYIYIYIYGTKIRIKMWKSLKRLVFQIVSHYIFNRNIQDSNPPSQIIKLLKKRKRKRKRKVRVEKEGGEKP